MGAWFGSRAVMSAMVLVSLFSSSVPISHGKRLRVSYDFP